MQYILNVVNMSVNLSKISFRYMYGTYIFKLDAEFGVNLFYIHVHLLRVRLF